MNLHSGKKPDESEEVSEERLNSSWTEIQGSYLENSVHSEWNMAAKKAENPGQSSGTTLLYDALLQHLKQTQNYLNTHRIHGE